MVVFAVDGPFYAGSGIPFCLLSLDKKAGFSYT